MRASRLQGALPYAVVLAGAAFLFAVAGRFQFAVKPGELGPDVWPKAILVLAMLVCLYEIVRRVLVRRDRRVGGMIETIVGEAGEEGSAPPARSLYLLAAGIGLTVLYAASLETVGFFFATAVFLAVFMIVGRYRRARVVVATSLLGSLAFLFVFMRVVYVSLPLGTGPFQTLSIWILGVLGVR